MNFYQLLQQKTKENPQKIFIIFDGFMFTYSDFLTLVDERKFTNHDIIVSVIQEKNYLEQLVQFFIAQKNKNIPIIIHEGLNFEMDFLAPHKAAEFGVLTSGTTGEPKILWRDCRSWLDFFVILNPIFNITEKTSLLLSGSFSFTGSLNMAIAVLFAGGTLIFYSNFCPKGILKTPDLTHVYLLPSKLELLNKVAKSNENAVFCSQVKQIITGSEALQNFTLLRLKNLYTEANIITYYGSSELSYLTFADETMLQASPNSVGLPFAGINFEEIGGKLYFNTPYAALGLEMPYPCQDNGYFNDKGHFVLLGRADNCINIKGNKIKTGNIEKLLLLHEKIDSAIVRGVKKKNGTLKLRASIVGNVSKKEIVEYLQQHLLPFEIPSSIQVQSKVKKQCLQSR